MTCHLLFLDSIRKTRKATSSIPIQKQKQNPQIIIHQVIYLSKSISGPLLGTQRFTIRDVRRRDNAAIIPGFRLENTSPNWFDRRNLVSLRYRRGKCYTILVYVVIRNVVFIWLLSRFYRCRIISKKIIKSRVYSIGMYSTMFTWHHSFDETISFYS